MFSVRHLQREIRRQRLRLRWPLADQPQATCVETTISHAWRWRYWRHRDRDRDAASTKGKKQDVMIQLIPIRPFSYRLASWPVTGAQTELFYGFNLRFSKCFWGRAPSWERFQELFCFVSFFPAITQSQLQARKKGSRSERVVAHLSCSCTADDEFTRSTRQ